MIRVMGPEFAFLASRRLKVKEWIADLEFSVDRYWPQYLVHISVWSDMCYFNFAIWPLNLVMFKYDKLGKTKARKMKKSEIGQDE
jgi:hypothetical protein